MGSVTVIGIIFSIIAGLFISVQGVFNTRLSEKIGLWETTAIVHATGLIFAVIIMLIYGNGSCAKLGEVNKIYLLGGVLGVLIVFSAIKGISLLGSAFSASIILITQLIVATIIDVFGLFGNQQIKFNSEKLIGVLIMVIGVIIFKLKG